MTDATFNLQEVPVHLGLGASVVPQEPFTGEGSWYERYAQRHASDGAEGRLVSVFTFTEPWTSWEVHPNGEELVYCISGAITLYQQRDEGVRTVELHAGDATVNPPGVWHTADVNGPATALFITAGMGTENKSRERRGA